MKKITSAVALGMTIFDLSKNFGWSHQMVEIMNLWCGMRHDCSICSIDGACLCDMHESKKVRAEKKHAMNERFAKRNTLRDVINSLEDEYRGVTGYHYWSVNRGILQKISEIGLTRLDCVALPQNTISPEALRKLPRKKLLNLDARLLGTITEVSMYKYRCCISKHGFGQHVPPATIGDILAGKGDYLFRSVEAENKTREALKMLGLRDNDGPFMQMANKHRLFVEKLMKDEDVSEEVAIRIAQIAEKLGWVKI